jgi:type IV secretory pathway VirB6-like protein
MPSGGNSVDYCANPPTDNGALSQNTREAYSALVKMDCPLSRIQSQYAKGILIGVSVIGQSGCKSGWFSFVPNTKDVAYLAAGVILILLFGFGFLVFPFLLLDVLMRVVLVAVTAPLSIASILFKPTAKIAERSLWTLIQCGFTLMFGAAIAGIGKALMAYILQQISALPNGVSLRNWTDLTSALEQSCNAGFHIDFSSAPFYMLCGTAMLMIFMMRRAGSLATELTGIAGSVGAQAAGAAIIGAAAGAAGRAGQLAAKYVVTRAALSKAGQVTGTSGNHTGSRSDEVSGNKQK